MLVVAIVGCGLLAAAVASGLYLNRRAATQAAELCAQIELGISEEQLLERARATGARHLQTADTHEFRFQGWVFNATSCVVRLRAGRVVAHDVVDHPD